jgi:hypothetical protein
MACLPTYARHRVSCARRNRCTSHSALTGAHWQREAAAVALVYRAALPCCRQVLQRSAPRTCAVTACCNIQQNKFRTLELPTAQRVLARCKEAVGCAQAHVLGSDNVNTKTKYTNVSTALSRPPRHIFSGTGFDAHAAQVHCCPFLKCTARCRTIKRDASPSADPEIRSALAGAQGVSHRERLFCCNVLMLFRYCHSECCCAAS